MVFPKKKNIRLEKNKIMSVKRLNDNAKHIEPRNRTYFLYFGATA
jgi:hypothetical protein